MATQTFLILMHKVSIYNCIEAKEGTDIIRKITKCLKQERLYMIRSGYIDIYRQGNLQYLREYCILHDELYI